MSICHACGTRHIPGERFCRKCGEKSRAFALTWTIGGAFLMLALAALIIMLLTAAGVLERPTPPLSALDQAGSVWVGGALALGFLLGGLAIGRVSEGRTILEAALAGAIALGLLIWFAQRRCLIDFALQHDQVAVGISVAAGVGLATLGAWLGEHWQGKPLEG